MRALPPFRLSVLIVCLLCPPVLLAGQSAAPAAGPAAQDAAALQTGAQPPAGAGPGELLLVLPFENDSGQANLDWIGEAVPELINRRLASAGMMPISRDDRLYAFDHLGLPQTFQPSRASAIRLAQTLDADALIVGSFSTSGQRFDLTAQILNMATLHMSAPLREETGISDLLEAVNTLAWQLTRQLDPNIRVSLKTFVAADSNLQVNAFESYIRGLIAPGTPERLDRLKESLRLDPNYAPAIFALGMAYFSDQQYDPAATTFGRLPADDPNAREADFYRGLSYLYTGAYEKAEDAFAFVSKQLPLPEVVNDEGVAASRRGQDGSALFRQAAAADPTDADYQFNLAVSLKRKNDTAGATDAITEALKLRPQDQEAQAFAASLRNHPMHPPPSAASNAAPQGDDAAPLERVKRTFNEAAFRQAALELEELDAQRLSALPAPEHAERLTEEGTRFLYQGLILEAEREFQAALAIDPQNANAHAGLAAVRERGGDAAGARDEAARSLALHPNITAYLVLAQLDLAAGQLPAAAGSVSHALAIEPQNSAARELRQQLEAKGQQIP